MKASLTDAAEQELLAAALRYAQEAEPAIGYDFIGAFDHAVELLLLHPKIGAVWQGRIRRLPLQRFPFTVVYELRGEEIRILAVAHQRRRPGFWRGRR